MEHPSFRMGAVVDELLEALRLLTGRADAQFRDGQREAIEALVGDRSRRC